MTSEQHNKYLGISFFIYSGFQAFFLLLMLAWFYFISSGLPNPPGDPAPPIEFFGFFFAFMTIFQLIFTAPAVVAGWAVLTKKKWARMASIVGAVMSSMSFPIGTAVCVYALWFFLGDKWKEVYEAPFYSSQFPAAGLNDADAWDPAFEEKVRQPEYQPKPGDWR